MPVLDSGAAPKAGVVPGELVFQRPAHRDLVDQISSALEATLALTDRGLGAGSGLTAALLTVVAVLQAPLASM